MRRVHLVFTIVLLALAGTVSAADVLIYGAPIRRGDFVAATVQYVRGDSVSIDMGYVDGVVSGHRFRVYRRVGRDLRISGVVIVGLVQRRQSIVTPRTSVPIRAGDAVVIAASQLAIWAEPRSRLYDETLRRRVARPRQFGYDTRQTEIDAVDLVELRRRNQLKLIEWSRRLKEARPGTTVLWDLTNLKTSREDFIAKLQAFGNTFRYRSREDRENASFTTMVQPISPSVPQAGQPYEPPELVEVSTKKSAIAPPKQIPRIVPLSRRVSQYLGRGNTR
ncbi:MAG: hypothetical protein VX669_06200 [Planctomycetota bacterium]|nr:hypothetical protein [Planctomycetota bacterium]MED5449328.1 hypothetical protein [Planctomycetota bacterium]